MRYFPIQRHIRRLVECYMKLLDLLKAVVQFLVWLLWHTPPPGTPPDLEN